MEGVDEKPRNLLLAPEVVRGGRGVEEGRERREGADGSGGVRTSLTRVRGRDEVGGGSESTDDTTRRGVVVQSVYGVHEG